MPESGEPPDLTGLRYRDRGGVAMTVIGIDAHKRTHTLVAIDSGGRKLGQKTVSANSSGHAEAMQWATTRFGTDITWAVEDNRSVTGLLERE
jgi:transposase